MIAEGIAHGHVLLADWLFLLAAIVFVVEAVILARSTATTITRGVLPAVGLALVAVAWLVL